jgi:hypothetical protein
MRSRAWLFLYSTRNIVGCAFALFGLGLYAAGVIDHYWLAIVAGLYGVGFLATPSRSGSVFAPDPSTSVADVHEALRRMLSSIKGRVEPDVEKKIESIVDAIGEAMPRLVEGEGAMSDALYTVRQMALDYLPGTLGSYVKLPPAYRRLHAVQGGGGGGKTAHDVLNDQLTLLDAKMQEILVSVNENDTQALLANGRFLREKFAGDGFRVA